jgi:hypothetical protein
MKKIFYLFAILVLLGFVSCGESWLDEPKSSQPSIEDLVSGSTSLDGMLVGAYSQGLHELTFIGYAHLWELLGDMAAPTAKMSPAIDDDARITYRRELFNVTWGVMGRFTQYSSRAVNMCNIIIDACEKDMPKDANYASQKNRLLGEALFFRSLIQFQYILMHGRQWDPNNLERNSSGNFVMMRTEPIYGTADIPLRRSTVKEAYDIIIESLKRAIELLPEQYDQKRDPATFQVRGNKNAAKFLLAKVYFQQSDFQNLKPLLVDLLGNTPGASTKFPLATNMSEIWERSNLAHTNNNEVIFEYFQTGSNTYNRNGKQLDRNVIRQLKDVLMRFSTQFKDSAAFEKGDKRFYELTYVYKNNKPENQLTYADAESLDANSDPADYKDRFWTSRKYKLNKNVPLFRSVELILMRAEIAALENRKADALADINYIRHSRGLSTDLTAVDGDVYKMVIRERVRELAMEGNRGWDLMRRGALTKGEVKLWAGERQPVLSDCYDGKVNVEWDATQLQYPLIGGEKNQNPLWDE